MDDGGERPGGAERAKNNLLTIYEFCYFIIIFEIEIRVATSDRRPPGPFLRHAPFVRCMSEGGATSQGHLIRG